MDRLYARYPAGYDQVWKEDIVLTAKEVADYFLAHVDEEAGDSLTNLKLQKLVYYAQGLHLALTGKPLFHESIEAWDHGPVVPGLYRSYKEHGSEAIPPPKAFDLGLYNSEVRSILDEIATVYGQFSASKLRNMTHDEAPWKQTAKGSIISQDLMREYFKSQLISN